VNTFTASVVHCTRNLLRFSGRDRPRIFWPYAGLVLGLSYFLSMLISLPLVMPILQRSFETVRAEAEAARAGGYAAADIDPAANLLRDFPEMVRAVTLSSAALMLLVCLLLAAAVTRRLHDRDRTGRWALLPIAFALPSLLLFPGYIESLLRAGDGGPFDPAPIGLLLVNNVLYLCSLGFLVYHLVSAGTPGKNRYGPDPLGHPGA